MKGISLIIPTCNRATSLRRTLNRLDQLEIPSGVEVEVLVIDNNCRDHTVDVVAQATREHSLPVRYLLETQQGLCFGRNRGLAAARFDHLAYLDDDILISPRWLVAYGEAQQTFGVDAVVGPVFPIFEQTPPEFLRGRALEIISSGYSRKGDAPLLLPHREAHQLPGCNFGVTRQMAQRLNGFQTHLDRVGQGMLAGGDTDFGHRLAAAGGRTAYHPGCWVQHVMEPEKLSLAYLRRRAFGLGATTRRMQTQTPSPWRRFRSLLGIGRLWSRVLWSRITQHPEAFNRELHAHQASGHLWG
jgi:glycosyltransferase involved in cell wall biosynthesis